MVGQERFRIFTVRFGFDSHTLDSIFFRIGSVSVFNTIKYEDLGLTHA